MQRYNLSAGQTPLSRSALEALKRRIDAPIYYPEYWQAELRSASLLQELLGTRSEVYLITGNATLGIEAAFSNIFSPGEAVITLNGGVFGQVLTEVASCCGLKPIEWRLAYGRSPDLEALEKFLRAHPKARGLALTHVETTTGIEFPLAEIAALAKSYDLLLLVDAVSSLGAQPVDMDRLGIDVCISSGQKALNAPQGLVIIALSDRAWRAIDASPGIYPGVCLNLNVWREYRQYSVVDMLKAWQTHTPSKPTHGKVIHGPSPSAVLVYALLGALEDIFREGLEKVFQRHWWAAKAVRAGVRALELEVLADELVAARTVTTVMLPDSVDELELRRSMLEKYGVALGGGPAEIGIHAVRIGSMGIGAHPRTLLPALEAFGKCLTGLGHPCLENAGALAAQEIFSQAGMGLWE
jgi:alanine-glyoxylate transaminase/serine-glyoxylate transaminase/serine-pyruvate transaminase